MRESRVVVTGLGMIGPLGTTVSECVAGWQAGRCAETACLPDLAGTCLAHERVGRLPSFDAAARLGGRRMLKFMSEAAVLGCLAAREALTAARACDRFAPEAIGLYAATGLAAASVNDVRPMIEQSIDETGRFSSKLMGERGLAATNPLLSFRILANMPPCLVSVLEGIKGPNLIFTPWEGQAAAALVEGWRAVADGDVPCAVVGAADTAAAPSTFAYLRQSGCLKAGEYPASGAAYLVLEHADTACRDGVPVLAAIRGLRIEPADCVADPLAARMGRLFAAAPAMLLGLACMCGLRTVAISGVDGQALKAELEPAA